MPTERPFRGFARRLTRTYVLLALGLIVAVGGATTTVAFIAYAGQLNEGVAAAADHVRQMTAVEPPKIVKELDRPRIRVFVRNAQHAVVAGEASHSSRIASAIADLLGIRGTTVPLAGGNVAIVTPDVDGFARFLLFYWSIIFPAGTLAALVAWLVGRRITGRAIEPLVDVTDALGKIAQGDFTPEPLLHHSTELRDLTRAYDDVAYRLSAATAERQRTETQMRQFVADAGHELRTPLTVIMGYIEALQGGVIRDPEGAERVYATMLGESRRMRTTIEKLILLARLERAAPPKREAIDVVALVRGAIDALEPVAGGRIAFAHSGAPSVAADEAELREAIKNVVENALKYAPDSPVEVGVGADAGGVRITICDRGPGMDATDVEHAFDRFYRGNARAATEGSGLGLAIAKRAVERAGGRIEIESQPGQGTRVSLILGSPASNSLA